ncbi:sarcosine oxidase subunit delta [Phaeovulum vinaykumarii]|uniref:Sarcosine oxidase subunit delta n=1 Tax=Phaeovulum vinaykumarii TaxID=407234 RepID=A0A1N7JR06_9RHOB|nr:sarcosine oxidase subunit delta [Phaeovulum vinaykumarii]SIS51691.1 sarcosine oxidase subunit delta [Phaeovulum vinaykumarii]SOB90873.1 heterotetrameric sarcosine oxidase delta subunit [Phaeovulum vinaykumarii]
MLRLTCPHCGVTAEETELTPGGEAHLRRAGPDATDAEFESYLFARKNPKGVVFERWRHAHGCGKWFIAARHSVSWQVFGTYPAQTTEPPADLIETIRAAIPTWEGWQ